MSAFVQILHKNAANHTPFVFGDPFDCEGIFAQNIILSTADMVNSSLEYTSLCPCLYLCALFQAENKRKESNIGVKRERIHTTKCMCFFMIVHEVQVLCFRLWMQQKIIRTSHLVRRHKYIKLQSHRQR